jgi:hypothetical protein
MLRGRHRGLPVAIDRAIMLPHEFEKLQELKVPIDGSRDSNERADVPALVVDEKGKQISEM